jgi:hypothetical protein
MFARIKRVVDIVLRLIGAIAVLAGLIVSISLIVGAISKPPPLDEQLDKRRHELAIQSYHAIAEKRVDLHGSGKASYFFVFRSNRRFPGTSISKVADRWVIYDNEDGRLHERMAFQPRARPDLIGPPVLRIDGIQDFDRDGRSEIIGGFASRYVDALGPEVPFLVAWDYRDKAPSLPAPDRGRVEKLQGLAGRR